MAHCCDSRGWPGALPRACNTVHGRRTQPFSSRARSCGLLPHSFTIFSKCLLRPFTAALCFACCRCHAAAGPFPFHPFRPFLTHPSIPPPPPPPPPLHNPAAPSFQQLQLHLSQPCVGRRSSSPPSPFSPHYQSFLNSITPTSPFTLPFCLPALLLSARTSACPPPSANSKRNNLLELPPYGAMSEVLPASLLF